MATVHNIVDILETTEITLLPEDSGLMVPNNRITLMYIADGASVHTENFLSYFVDRGYDVHLITFNRSKIKNVEIHYLSPSKIKIPLRFIQPLLLMKKIRPKVLHAFYATHNGAVGAWTGFHPFVLSVMGGDVTVAPETSRIIRLMVKFALKRADMVNVSDSTLKERLEELSCDSKKILLQEWAVNVREFSPEARDEDLRMKLGISDSYSVINAYSWEPNYSVDVLIRAIPYVLKEIPNAKFILLGGGSLEGKLKELARELGVYERVLFVGKVPKSVMPKYLASVDAIVDTLSDYAHDTSGRVVRKEKGMGIGQTNREAMACATPQILSDSVSFKSYKPFKGLMYRQLNHKDLAEKIIQLLEDEKLRERIGEESREYVMEHCNEDIIMKNWERIYHNLSK